MKSRYTFILIMQAFLLLASSCHHDEPENYIKPEDQRKVLFLTNTGEIYDQNDQLVTALPNCTFASQIISEKGDYFVSGTNENKRVGYWKNGKWNTLHVDFIEDVNHWIDGIGKWDSYIYLLDHPHVLKNSGIFRIEEAKRFLPAKEALAVSEGECYVVGHKVTDDSNGEFLPVLYTEHKGVFTAEILPLFGNAIRGECTCVYAYNRTHCLIGGSIDGWPVIWVDKKLEVLPLSEASIDDYDIDTRLGEVCSITECNGEVYAAGTEVLEEKSSVATIWHNGEIRHLEYFPDISMSSEVVKIMTYGSDVYVVTLEYFYDENQEFITTTVLWKNEAPVLTITRLQTTSFTVI